MADGEFILVNPGGKKKVRENSDQEAETQVNVLSSPSSVAGGH